MSKLSFRARALDASKPLPVFRCEDLPDLHEYASINRAVPQMPTGMEKEEESDRGVPLFSAPAFTKWRPVFTDVTRRISPLNVHANGREPRGFVTGARCVFIG
ncbi:hypothetical protein WMY93_000391 [Mugilogobius chulae]|uniref:Enhancer of polycomb homolog 1 n=1 Tax=Mugilogobius chulae TaxID=88201 RepID=A0AAW0Q080_9GOBI